MTPHDPEPTSGEKRPFLRVLFECCHVYSRVYRHPSGRFYDARCPRCLRAVRIEVAPDGIAARDFVVR